MTKKIKFFALCLMILMALVMQNCGKKGEKVVEISGSRTMGPMLLGLAESYKKNNNAALAMQELGSLKGISSILEGKCDIASSSVKMPSQQIFEAQRKGIVLKEFIVAYDIIIPIAHPSNKIKNLFQGQLADIYTGLIKDWKTVEGKPGTILVVDRDEFSGTRLLMSERFFESNTVVEGSIKKKTDTDIIAYVAMHPTSVGYISQRFINKSVKALNINSFSATQENVEKGYYPLYRELYLYVNEKSYKGNVKSFIEYCMGKSGQDLIEKTGFIPVNRMNIPTK